MKNNIGLAAVQAMLLGATEFAGKHPGIAARNRHHDDRSRPGSQEEIDRMAAAQAKRDRKNAKRLRESQSQRTGGEK